MSYIIYRKTPVAYTLKPFQEGMPIYFTYPALYPHKNKAFKKLSGCISNDQKWYDFEIENGLDLPYAEEVSHFVFELHFEEASDDDNVDDKDLSIDEERRVCATNFAHNVKTLRKLRGLSRAELMRISGASYTALKVLEDGSGDRMPSIDTLLRMSKIFNTGIDLLLYQRIDGGLKSNEELLSKICSFNKEKRG